MVSSIARALLGAAIAIGIVGAPAEAAARGERRDRAAVRAARATVEPTPVAEEEEEEPEGVAPSARGSGALDLREVVRMALRAAPEDRAAAAAVARAEAQGDLASSAYLPRLDAVVRGGGQLERGTFLFREDSYVVGSGHVEARGSMRLQIYDFGRTSNAVSAAEASRVSAEHAQRGARLGVVRRAVSAYATILFDEQIVASKKTSLKHRTRYAAIAKGLVTHGVRPPVDEARARVNLESARHDLTLAETTLAIDRGRLAVLLGLEPDGLPAVTTLRLPDVEDDPGRSVASSERRRPEVAAASSAIEAGEHRAAASRAAYLPRIDLDGGGSYRVSRFDYAEGTIPRADVSGGLAISVPLFDAAIGARASAARAELSAARADSDLARRRVRLEAYEAAVGLKAARALSERARDVASAARAALAVIDARYAQGLATALELVDAEQADLEAREGLLAAELRMQLATVELLCATGRAERLEDG